MIDLNELNYKDKILIDDTISYSKDYLKDSDILELNNVKVNGSIYVDYEKNNVIELKVKGTMMITDAITTETVPYDFEIEIEEILENSLKTLDLIEFLWHYIVLEIPIRYTTSDPHELKNKYKDVYLEEEVREVNNPFKDFFKE
ncbi:MAG: hypothetical protein MR266_05235 [Erysipelotrichaceae bacterium]|nr:hypothetical protein [Erysipelotrichaceae bacterium]